MAGSTVIYDTRMVEHTRGEATGLMTDAAILCSYNVVGLHAHG